MSKADCSPCRDLSFSADFARFQHVWNRWLIPAAIVSLPRELPKPLTFGSALCWCLQCKVAELRRWKRKALEAMLIARRWDYRSRMSKDEKKPVYLSFKVWGRTTIPSSYHLSLLHGLLTSSSDPRKRLASTRLVCPIMRTPSLTESSSLFAFKSVTKTRLLFSFCVKTRGNVEQARHGIIADWTLRRTHTESICLQGLS